MSRFRCRLEQLETRWCPSVTATLKSDTLTVSGTADNGSINIVQDSATAGKITVLDGLTAVSGSPFTGVKNIRLSLTSAADSVSLDFGGQTLTGSVAANLGGGANTMSVVNGSIANWLTVSSGDSADTFTLGDGTKSVSVKDASIALFGGIDSITIKSGASITRSLSTWYANNMSFDAGSTLTNAFIQGGSGGNTIVAAGDVTGNLAVNAFFFFGGSSDSTSFTMSGEVDGNLSFGGSNLGDKFTVSGNVGKGLFASTFGGADSVTISGAVSGGLALDTGDGNDQITLSSVIGGSTYINAGSGDDALSIAATASFLKSASVSMGSGADSVTLDNAASFTTLLINGGTGTDIFTGNKTKTGLTLVSF